MLQERKFCVSAWYTNFLKNLFCVDIHTHSGPQAESTKSERQARWETVKFTKKRTPMFTDCPPHTLYQVLHTLQKWGVNLVSIYLTEQRWHCQVSPRFKCSWSTNRGDDSGGAQQNDNQLLNNRRLKQLAATRRRHSTPKDIKKAREGWRGALSPPSSPTPPERATPARGH